MSLLLATERQKQGRGERKRGASKLEIIEWKRRMGRRAEKKRVGISRNRTRAQEEEKEEKPDRLSDLPDPIIHQILAFLELKYAIQTCVLSKRWKNLWVSLPDIKFNDLGFTRSKFKNFVLKVLFNGDDCNICKFQLRSCSMLDQSLVRRVLNYVVSHNVQHLDINLGFWFCRSSRPALTCNTLKTLKLDVFALEDLAESFSSGFTMLTSMDLTSYKFHHQSKNGSADLCASYPNLKNLCLRYCYFSNLQEVKISGLQLLNLKIVDVFLFDSKLEIFAPNLTSFYFESPNFGNFSRLDIPSLCYADIRLVKNPVWVHGTLVENEKYCLGFITLFRGLYNAEVLRLSSGAIDKLLKCFPNLEEQQPSPFKRLKSLQVECDGNSLTIPHHVKKYLLGDNLYEETMYTEVTRYGKIRYAEFRKVQADVQLLPNFKE